MLGEEPADVLYKVDSHYNRAGEAGIIWHDPELGASWPVGQPIVSDRDQELPTFADYRANPDMYNILIAR